jgi:hypothetical protein
MSFSVTFYYSLGEFSFKCLPSLPYALRLSLRIGLLLSSHWRGVVLCARPVGCEGAKEVLFCLNLGEGGGLLSRTSEEEVVVLLLADRKEEGCGLVASKLQGEGWLCLRKTVDYPGGPEVNTGGVLRPCPAWKVPMR